MQHLPEPIVTSATTKTRTDHMLLETGTDHWTDHCCTDHCQGPQPLLKTFTGHVTTPAGSWCSAGVLNYRFSENQQLGEHKGCTFQEWHYMSRGGGGAYLLICLASK